MPRFVVDAVGWGFALWLFGYVLGVLLFAIVPMAWIGWIIFPIGTIVTIWLLLRRVHGNSFVYFLGVGLVWSLIAVTLDYFLLVKLFDPPDGYYKLDVYLYYFLIFALPLVIGFVKTRKTDHGQ